MPAKDDYEKYSAVAEELGLEDEEKESFISSAMKRRGYRPRTAWEDPEPESGKEKEDGDFFSSRRKEREDPARGREREQPRRSGQYG